MTTVFFFCHQDDEIGVYQKISNEIDSVKKKSDIKCIYITSGVPDNNNPKTRNNESIKVLNDLGIKNNNIYFIGAELSIADLKLQFNLVSAYKWIRNFLSKQENIKKIYVTSWEGGHPDHDCLNFIVSKAAISLGFLDKVYQYPLYNSYKCPWYFFKVFSPIPHNGSISSLVIPWKNRIKFISYIFSYRSQLKTFIGLLPFIFFHYFIIRKEYVQKIKSSRINQKPHHGYLYYEKRRFSTWNELNKNLINFK